ncbi:MAG: rhomboid family intramembrane serine protease [Bacteroidales bacterium]|jgi:membrane associated rhomboid family serine protease|nr:rhomboid family intramembrane serine protease [Bacteroidales bacterium]
MNQEYYSPRKFSFLPLIVKNLLIINALFYVATLALQNFEIDLTHYLGLYYPQSDMFRPWQIVTYMFMHGGFRHLFFNMFALWMFGYTIENLWGGKRFLIYYFVTGIGAAAVHILVQFIQLKMAMMHLSPDESAIVFEQGQRIFSMGKNFINEYQAINLILNVPTVGASGSIYGILLAFGMLFPNALIYLYFFIPIKAKWFVILYGGVELISGVMGTHDGVAHFAHLGGMIFGVLLILLWRKRGNMDYYY